MKQRGVSLIELIMFIVIISVGVAGILGVMSKVTARSADTLVRKQSLAIAESLLEEIELMPFTYCDPNDASAVTAASPAGCTNSQDVLGPVPNTETRYSAANPFDNVGDYQGFSMNGINDITNTAIAGLAGYSASAVMVKTGAAFLGGAAVAGDALQITVNVTGPDGLPVLLDGYRTRYAPNSTP